MNRSLDGRLAEKAPPLKKALSAKKADVWKECFKLLDDPLAKQYLRYAAWKRRVEDLEDHCEATGADILVTLEVQLSARKYPEPQIQNHNDILQIIVVLINAIYNEQMPVFNSGVSAKYTSHAPSPDAGQPPPVGGHGVHGLT